MEEKYLHTIQYMNGKEKNTKTITIILR